MFSIECVYYFVETRTRATIKITKLERRITIIVNKHDRMIEKNIGKLKAG